MEPRKPGKFRLKLKQRLTYRLLIATGVSAVMITAVLVIYFQFFQNEVTKAKSLQVQVGGALPVEMVVTEKIVINTDTCSLNGNRYKIAKPINR